MNLFSATSPKVVRDAPIENTTNTNTKVIVIVLTLLTLLILITLIVFYVMYVRRRNFRKQGNSYSSIHLLTIKNIYFCYTKLKSRRLWDPYFYPQDLFFEIFFQADFRGLMYRSIPKPPISPRANRGTFDFFKKFWSNSLLCCQFRRFNAPPVWSSKRVKFPTLQAC